MILPFITDINSIAAKKVNLEPEIENLGKEAEEIVQISEAGNVTLDTETSDNESYEDKYKKLMQKIEKERFERDLLAGNR